MELVIENGSVVTMNEERRVLRRGFVVVEGGFITAVGRGGRRRPPRRGRRVIDASGCAVIPGFVQAHLHACQTLGRGVAEGLELLPWLRERIWPLEASHDRSTMRASADLTCLELLRSGTTSALDMGSVHHTDAIFEAARDAGLRLVGGKCMMDAGQAVPAGLRESTRWSVDESLRLLDAWHGAANGRLRYAFAPRFVPACSEALLSSVVDLARRRGVRVHTHASENVDECALVRERTGLDNVAYFAKLGLLGPGTTLAHCVWLTSEEQRLLRESGTSVCHCPSSNLKLGSGVAKVPELLEQGVPVALGSDGAACANNLDLFVELRLAALLQGPRLGPAAMPPMRVLEMATLHGARALGLEREIGSIEVGKRADVCVVDLSGPHVTPGEGDPVSALVFSCRGSDVRDVIVDGEVLVRGGRVRSLDPGRVLEAARVASRKLRRAIDDG